MCMKGLVALSAFPGIGHKTKWWCLSYLKLANEHEMNFKLRQTFMISSQFFFTLSSVSAQSCI